MAGEAHGSFAIRTEGDIVIVTLRGAWNLEGAMTYFQELEKVVEAYQKRPWCRVVDYTDYDLHTPEVTAAQPKLSLWCQLQGCVEQVYVGCNKVDRKALDFSYKDSGMTYVACETVDDAVRYCRCVLTGSPPPAGLNFILAGDTAGLQGAS
ncbi:hypothetical protein [Spongiibacter sp.]|uniref:hypothetical protein n=1 Tax=Spongiibacter sp. TaxID=2024860 RepID=UPI0035617CB5